ncbi:uroporphyrinogen-III C-methyltransferase [Pseudobacteroides cellulosolvens]|uniref:uroporphyrinogen-III C-methyltransferase n=1 Tax=Pseudobacteroides cellulosolvens ATCC 35603 = DSM 2933 TaxID=398512 RepID=A0A0L6JQD8_9FIRM|nr:uroporphyrinogen-III C-methyltransferase [Pseudobacteroides cellulosolvens]KNY28004.1 uroporphyrin-III C-methyltransferase [Pseudobacteroides cellulosolvens ATCC 35603 = DSM 2933]
MIDKKGIVYILGAGPGDYGLLTLKAADCIRKADVIVYDRLINASIFSLAKKDAEYINVGKMPDHHAVPQETINQILLDKALEGRVVARVKGGDPFIFGRGGEEAEVLQKNGIEFEIVPGITSAVAAAAYAGIPVTHREYCSSLHIITGHEKPGRDESFIDYEVISKLEGTLVFLMGMKNLDEISTNLIKHGKKSTTPAAVIERGTTISQRVVVGTLEDISKKVIDEGIKSPAVTVIGNVVALSERLNWFPKGKLKGKRIVVTRAREQASSLVEEIRKLGGDVIEFPTIRIEEPLDYQHFDRVLRDLNTYKWVVFTSVNGVKGFFKRMRTLKIDIRSLAGIHIAAVGEATAMELSEVGLNVDYMPDDYTTKELLKGLVELMGKGEKVLLARADIASKELSEGLKSNDIDFEELTVYRTVMEASMKSTVEDYLKQNKVDFITFASSSTVKNFIEILGKENMELLSKTKIVCIGPVTSQTAKESGLFVSAVADKYTIDGLVDKLVELSEE